MRGLAAAQAGRLVTFGVKPTRADTGYGYIQSGEPMNGIDASIRSIASWRSLISATAQRFVDSGTFFWNSGIFLLSARAYLGELARINPEMLSACERAVQDGKEDLAFFRLCAKAFGEAPALSIDHAVMEHTTRAAVVPVDMAGAMSARGTPCARSASPMATATCCRATSSPNACATPTSAAKDSSSRQSASTM